MFWDCHIMCYWNKRRKGKKTRLRFDRDFGSFVHCRRNRHQIASVMRIMELCSYCRKRLATKLCDAPIGTARYIAHPPRTMMQKAKSFSTAFLTVKMKWTETCDMPICDECATEISRGIDYCPRCMERIRQKPVRYKKTQWRTIK